MPVTSIADIRGRQVLDSRGNPTVEAEVFLDGGASASLKMLEAAQAEQAKAQAQSEIAAARFALHWGPLAALPPAEIGLTAAMAARHDCLRQPPTRQVPLLIAVGGAEPIGWIG